MAQHFPGRSHLPALAAACDGPSLADALGAAENRLRVAGLRTRTRAEYLDEGRNFLGWLRATMVREPLVSDISVAAADTFLLARQEAADERGRPWARATLRHHVRTLRALAAHLAAACSLPADPLEGLSASRHAGRREPRPGDGLADDELEAVLAGLHPSRPYDAVTRALVALGYEVGPRTSELAGLDVEDLRTAWSGRVELGPVVTVRWPAKTSPERVLPLGVRAEDILRRAIGHRASGPLFPGRDGRRMTVRALRDRVARAGARAGVPLHPQRLRRSAASWQAAYGAPTGHLDRVFGWAPDPRDVRSGSYVIPTEVQLLFAHQARLSPLDRLELRRADAGLPPLA